MAVSAGTSAMPREAAGRATHCACSADTATVWAAAFEEGEAATVVVVGDGEADPSAAFLLIIRGSVLMNAAKEAAEEAAEEAEE
jgi:hypothetical protein